jgi:hypothetical protein
MSRKLSETYPATKKDWKKEKPRKNSEIDMEEFERILLTPTKARRGSYLI